MRLSYHVFNIPQLSSKVSIIPLRSVNLIFGSIIIGNNVKSCNVFLQLDIRQEYMNWLQKKDKNRNVCFLEFPFVFDAQAKTMLLQVFLTDTGNSFVFC